MEKLVEEEVGLLGVAMDDLRKMYEGGKEIGEFLRSDEWFDFSGRLRDIQDQYRRVKRWVDKTKDRKHSCEVRIEMVIKQLEFAERQILKFVPESAKLDAMYGYIVENPSDTTAKTIAWMEDYAAYLYGMAYAFGLMENFLPTISMLKSDIKGCKKSERCIQEKEMLWSDISELKVDIKKFSKDFEEARLQKEKEACNNLESVVERLSLEKDH